MRIGIRELSHNTSRYLAKVKNGQTVQITEHGRVVAVLSPVRPTGSALLDQLIAEGRARPASGDLRELLKHSPPVQPPEGVSVSEDLIAMRDQERQ